MAETWKVFPLLVFFFFFTNLVCVTHGPTLKQMLHLFIPFFFNQRVLNINSIRTSIATF